MSNMQRIRGMLGFAARARKTVCGTELCSIAMAKGTAKLIVVSSGASAATKKKLFTKSEFYNIKAIEVELDTEELGRVVGKTCATAAVALTDQRFADEILKA